MPSRSQVKAGKKPVGNPKEPSNWRATVLNGGIVLSTALVQVAQCASVLGLQHAAQAISTVLVTIERVRANKEDFQIIADDATELIVAISHAQEKAKNPRKWLSPEVRDMVMDLRNAFVEVNKIAKRQTNRNMVIRVIFYMADVGKIRQTREKINTAVTKFQVLSHLNLTDLLHEMMSKQQELSEQMKNRNESDNLRGEEEEEDEETDEEETEEEETEEEEEEEESAPAVSKKAASAARVRPPPTPPFPSSSIQGFSFSNSGSGQMYNNNVGNIVNNTLSNIGNNHSVNYIYESSRHGSPGVRRRS